MPAPKLTQEFLIQKIELINSPKYKDLRQDDFKRWMMYHGSIKEIVHEAIKNEFKPETVQELIQRLIPINIPSKIVNKLANVYNEPPLRMASDRSESDQEFINILEDGLDINVRMKEANRYFKLYKRNLMEAFIDEKGIPSVRNLPRHTFEVFSHSAVSPDRPDMVIKFLNFATEPEEQLYAVWTDREHKIINGKGVTDLAKMTAMKNPAGINPLGVLPFVYTNESTFSVNPIPDDDLLRMGVVFPLLLSDLAFAMKYLSWSVIYTIGASGDIPYSPNSIIDLPFGPDGQKPEIGTVKPTVDIDKALRFIEFLVATLLTTKNLSASAIAGTLNASNVASGVSKALDAAESQEDKKDQQGYFLKTERDLWDLLSKRMIPYWKKNRLLAPDYNREFSSAFTLTQNFREPKVLVSEKDQIETSKLKLDAGLTTIKRELRILNPDYDEQDIDQLYNEIMEEKKAKLLLLKNEQGNQDEEGEEDIGNNVVNS